MADVSNIDLERIKIEELKKIEELEKAVRTKKLKVQDELNKLKSETVETNTQANLEIEKLREEIRKKELIARGFVQVDGEWMTREEAEQKEREKEEQKKLEEEKLLKAKQRKIAREKNEYEEYKANVILHVKFYSIMIYVSLALIIAGCIMLFTATNVRTLMATFFFPGLIFLIIGFIAFFTFIGLLIDSEKGLIEKSIFKFSNEIYVFEDEENITDYVRKICRKIVKKINPRLDVTPTNNLENDDDNDDDNQNYT